MYIYLFYSLAVEAGFYGDTGRVIGFYTKLSNMHKQHASRLVPGWVTVMLDFIEDPFSCYNILTLAMMTSSLFR